ncbi:hypothetical protein NDU88_007473 [Pleurodeles waltl]|uniref:Uncharacterized protein n=1 Tax=Pleurodeles waltl TaxID=8319 RepID=A0AAV7NW20_PLEWA|nr:hypothetical protein NDU88_007473 [Pleurodeles waltl]
MVVRSFLVGPAIPLHSRDLGPPLPRLAPLQPGLSRSRCRPRATSPAAGGSRKKGRRRLTSASSPRGLAFGRSPPCRLSRPLVAAGEVHLSRHRPRVIPHPSERGEQEGR